MGGRCSSDLVWPRLLGASEMAGSSTLRGRPAKARGAESLEKIDSNVA